VKKYFLFVFLSALIQIISAQVSDFEKALYNLPDVRFEKMKTPEGYESAYKLYVRQPIDHLNPEKGIFYQKVYVSHKAADKPVVIITEGYSQRYNYIFELTKLLDANQILVEHRYFGESVPDSIDYTYLKADQEAADLHKINLLFKEIYKGKWVSTGVSKGGQNAIYYRYFYPGDVDVSVPYVAPVNLSKEDDRIYSFLKKVGTDECREKIKNFQIRMLKNRDKIMPLLMWYSLGAGLSYTYLSMEKSFEYSVLEYSFSFWQWGHNCSEIPSDKVPIDSALRHLLAVSNINFFSDLEMKNFKSHYYQCAVEFGYYGYNTDDFRPYLKALPVKPHPSAIFTPDKMVVKYDSVLSKKVFEWATTKGDKMVYIYGANDTWSATGIPPSQKPEALWFILKDQSHGTARIINMSPMEKKTFIQTLEKWLNIDLMDD
jgi:hypothetical protein